MRISKRNFLITLGNLLLLFLQLPFALAQSNATLSLTGSIEPSLSITISNVNASNNSSFFANMIIIDKKRVRVELRGTGSATENLARFTVQLRSNTGYKLEAAVLQTSGNTTGSQFGLGNLSASGQRTSATAVSNSRIADGFELKNDLTSGNISLLQQPQVILSGPRISEGGGLLAVSNALNVDMAFKVNSEANQPWTIYLELRISAKQ